MKKKTISIIIIFLLQTCVLIAARYESLTQDTVTGSKDQKNIHGMIMFDALGFITMGPSLVIEPAIGKYVGINTGIRLHNLGLVQSRLHGSMDMSYMIHFSVKYYVKPKQKIDGFFLGPGIEYGRSNYSTGATYNVRALGGGLGYKFVFKKGFCLAISDYIGIVQSKRIDVDYDTEWVNDLFVFYLLSVQLGYAF
jgi:hypothetical protein